MNNSSNDAAERLQALNPKKSFIVQAPAGSGKTELLTQRFLVLLSNVTQPEEILAITFTKKSSAEMRARIINSLKNALNHPEPEATHAKQTWNLARRVLKQSQELKWNLLENPNRLRIQTIDSFNAYLTKQLPILSNFGAPPEITNDPSKLYLTAIQEFLSHLEENVEWDEVISLAIQSTIGPGLTNLRYLTLESQRLHALLWNWLQLEKTRPAFKVISQEQELTTMIGKIPITLRVDRIDELSTGCHLIIDYKTGKNNHIKYWFSERPDEPQLPIYCITDPKNTIGIAFAEIHPNNLILKGISKKNLDIATIKPLHETNYAENKNWEEQLQTWYETLEKIANHFYEGNATVDPKDIVETCRYCDLKALCRIHEDQGLYE